MNGLGALHELLEDLARFEGEITETDALALALVFVELDLSRILLERGEQRDGRGITELGERLDRGGDRLGIGMFQEATQELHAARLADLREEERKLRERGAPIRQPIDSALDAERDLLEAIERQALERLAGLHARLGRLAAEDVDEQIDHLVTVQIAEKTGDARQAQRRLLVVGGGKRGLGGFAQLLDELGARSIGEAVVELSRRTLGVEKGSEVLFYRGHGRLQYQSRPRAGEWRAWPGSLELVSRWLWAGGAAVAFMAFGAGRPLAPMRVATAGTRDPDAAGHTATVPALARTECPPGTAPDHDACVHLTRGAEDGPLLPSAPNIHREKSGRLKEYEQIPRLPDRPSDYDAYRYPIPPGLPNGHYVVSGYDLDRPDPEQRRGRTLSHVGHGGVDLPQAKGTPVKNLVLEHQEGETEVLYTGPLFGTTVVTRHSLREGGRLRDYVVLFGHLDSIAVGVAPGATLKDGDLVGAVGDTSSPQLVHLHYEVRRVREGVDLAKVPAGAQLLADSVSVVCDPRNVLPLK